MIAFISGQILHKGADSIIVNAGGIGYHSFLPVRLIEHLKIGQAIELHTHHQIREDAHELYGFLHRDELDLFKQLLSVKGVGPKTALSVLNEADGAAVSQAIAAGDPGALSQTAGISLKNAERIVLDLKNKVIPFEGQSEVGAWKTHQEVIEALVSLGYSNNQAQSVVKKLPAKLDDTESQLKEALKILGGQK